MKIKNIFVVFVLLLISSVFASGQTKTSKKANDSVQTIMNPIIRTGS